MFNAGPTEWEGRKYGLGLEEYHSPCGTVWGHDGALPGYRSDNYTDKTGRRTVSALSTTHFGLKTSPDAGAAETKLVDAAICTMLGKLSRPTSGPAAQRHGHLRAARRRCEGRSA